MLMFNRASNFKSGQFVILRLKVVKLEYIFFFNHNYLDAGWMRDGGGGVFEWVWVGWVVVLESGTICDVPRYSLHCNETLIELASTQQQELYLANVLPV